MITLFEALILSIMASIIIIDYTTGREYAPTMILIGSIASVLYHDYILLIILSIMPPVYRMLLLLMDRTYVKSGGLRYLGSYTAVIIFLLSMGFILGEYYEKGSLPGLDPWTSGFIVLAIFYTGLIPVFTARIKDVVFAEKLLYPNTSRVLGFSLLLYYILVTYTVFLCLQAYGVSSLSLSILLLIQYWAWRKLYAWTRYLVLLLYPSTLLVILIVYW